MNEALGHRQLAEILAHLHRAERHIRVGVGLDAHPVGFPHGYDLVGDLTVEVRPVVVSVSSSLDIAGLRDGCREPLSRLPTRHENRRCHLPLAGQRHVQILARPDSQLSKQLFGRKQKMLAFGMLA